MHSLIERTRLLVTPLLLVVLVTTTAAFFAEDQPGRTAPDNTVVLPIEVIGPDDYTETVRVVVGGAAGVDRLYLQLHAAAYHPGTQKYKRGAAKASVRINDGPWQEITDETFTCEYPENAFGCIDGVYHTVRGTLPVRGVRRGVNTITFRFNGTDGIGAGYRVLALDLRSGSASAVRGTRFVDEDPTTWAPPEGYDNPADIRAGEQLWHNAALVESSLDDARMIKAACADCHATDGRDLKYFNYSNQSIVARSQFHGLSAKEGRQIAAYIRDIQLRLEDGTPYEAPGRPWNPPYQPGPTLAAPGTAAEGMHPDEAPTQYWASGAGLEWVLEKDIEALPYIFPDPDEIPGPDGKRTQYEITAAAVDVDSTLNMREIPAAVQFPDWNNWLPDVHPLDMGTNFLGSKAHQFYRSEVLPALARYDRSKSRSALGDVDRAIKRWYSRVKLFDRSIPARKGTAEAEMQALSVKQWALVKFWQFHHGHYLADKADELYQGRGRYKAIPEADWTFEEPRSWIGRERVVFDLGPHISSANGWRNAPFVYGSKAKDAAFTHLWYHLQIIINPGADPESSSQTPVDWKYQRQFMNVTAEYYGVPQAMRKVQSWVKKSQMLRGSLSNPHGWGPQQQNIARIARQAQHDQFYGALNPALRAKVTTALSKAWIDYVGRYFTASDFPRGYDNDSWEPAEYTPTMITNPRTRVGYLTSQRRFADAYYNAVPVLAAAGVEASVLRDVAKLGSQLWPNPRGPAWMDLAPNKPEKPSTPPPPKDDSKTPPDDAADVPPDDAADVPPDDAADVPPDDAADVPLDDASKTPPKDESKTPPKDESKTPPKDESKTPPDDAKDASLGKPVRPVLAVRISAPAEGSVFTAPTTIVVQTELTGKTAKHVERVEFYADGKKVGQRAKAPFEYAWRVRRPGRYALSARLVMTGGTDTTSAPVTVTLKDAAPPAPPVARQEIRLRRGWNFVSGWVQPKEAAIAEVLKDVLSSVVLVKNDQGQAFIPRYDINTIGSWDPKEAYMIYVDANVAMTMEGAATNPTLPIKLEEGWNLVPYLHERPMPAAEALASILSDVVIAKDYAGGALIPQHNINNIGHLEPGYGYKVYLKRPATLVYPEASDEGVPINGPLTASRAPIAVPETGGLKKGSPSSAVIIVEAPELKDGQRIVARGETSGRVGEGVVREGRAVITVYGDERATPDIVEGALADEALTLRLATLQTPGGAPLMLTEVRSGLSGTPAKAPLHYAPDAFLLTTAQKGPTEFVLEQNYPNPFKEKTTITYSLPKAAHVTLEVYDMLGRRVATIVSEQQKAGWHHPTFEASSLPSGMYFYRLRAGERTVSKEMIIVR